MGKDGEVSCGVLSSGHDKAIAEMTHSISGHFRKIKPVKNLQPGLGSAMETPPLAEKLLAVDSC